ncbi:MAG: hypothetical protein RIR51_8 [Bacteroidota bacterium]|jgi:hypothetical protein
MYQIQFKLNGDFYLFNENELVGKGLIQIFPYRYYQLEYLEEIVHVYKTDKDILKDIFRWKVEKDFLIFGNIVFWRSFKRSAFIHILDAKHEKNYFELKIKGIFCDKFILYNQEKRLIFQFKKNKGYNLFFPKYTILDEECLLPKNFYYEILLISAFNIRYFLLTQWMIFLGILLLGIGIWALI